MKLLTTLSFQVDFKNDQIESNGRIIQDGGKNITEEISSLLTKNDMIVESVELYVEHGWEMIVTFKGVKFWILVTDLVEEKFLQIENLTFFVNKLFRGNDIMADFLNNIHRILLGDARFYKLRWYPKMANTSKGLGSSEPVIFP